MSNQGFFNWVVFNSLLLFVLLAVIALWRRPSWWLPLLTLLLGIIVGWFDVKATEVSISVLMLLAFGIFAGFAAPRSAWLSALFLGIWVPVFALVAANLHLTNPTTVELVTSFLSLLFAFAGAYAGVVIRHFAPREPISATR